MLDRILAESAPMIIAGVALLAVSGVMVLIGSGIRATIRHEVGAVRSEVGNGLEPGADGWQSFRSEVNERLERGGDRMAGIENVAERHVSDGHGGGG